ncbi:ABC transporter permease [Schinkia sp. CFF1]
MKLMKAFRLACVGLWANRFRVFLSMLGVIIGVFAVIVLSSIAIGVKDTVMKQLGGLGAEQMMVIPGRVLTDTSGSHNFLSGISSVSSTLTYQDVEEIKKVEGIKSVTPHLETVGRVQYGGSDDHKEVTTVEGMLIGTSASYQNAQHLGLAEGRFFNDGESEGKQRVVVLGSNIHSALLNQSVGGTGAEGSSSVPTVKPERPWWQRLFDRFMSLTVNAEGAEESLLGKEVLIQGQKFKVIGILESRATLGMTTDNSIFIPIQTALEITKMKNLTQIYVQAPSLGQLDEMERAVYSAVAKNHSESDFSVVKQTEMLKAVEKVTKILQVMLLGITATALLISGVGIMNVMVMSVRERTREIGIRKALGATTIEIMYQFFFETILLCLIGGVIGLLLGYGFVEWWNSTITVFSLVLPLWIVQLSLVSSVAVGCICGIYPAVKAAKLQPSQALRFE